MSLASRFKRWCILNLVTDFHCLCFSCLQRLKCLPWECLIRNQHGSPAESCTFTSVSWQQLNHTPRSDERVLTPNRHHFHCILLEICQGWVNWKAMWCKPHIFQTSCCFSLSESLSVKKKKDAVLKLEDACLGLPLNFAHCAPSATGELGCVVWKYRLEGVKIKPSNL